MSRYVAACKSYWVVFGAMCIMFCMGSAVTYGNINPYIASYIVYLQNKQDIDECRGMNSKENCCTTEIMNDYNKWKRKVPWIYSTALLCQAFLGPVAGKLDITIGARYTCLLGCILMVIGMFAAYFTKDISDLFAGYIVTLGIIFGCGFGIGFTGSIVAASSWWPNKKGFVSGLVLASMGFGITAFNSIQTPIINPLNIKFDKKCAYVLEYHNVLKNIHNCFGVLGIVLTILSSIGVLLLFDSHKYTRYIKARDRGNYRSMFTETLNINTRMSNKFKTPTLISSRMDDNNDIDTDTTVTLTEKFDLPFLTINLMIPTRIPSKQLLIERNEIQEDITFETNNNNNNNNNNNSLLKPPTNNSIEFSTSINKNNRYQKQSISKIYGSHPNRSNRASYFVPNEQSLQQNIFYLDKKEQKIQYTLCESLKTYKFWQLFIIATFNYTINVFFLSYWKEGISKEYFGIIDDYWLLIIGDTSAMFYGIGRVIWGLYFDMFNKSKNQFKFGMGTLAFFETIFVSLLLLNQYLKNKYDIKSNKMTIIVLVNLSLILFTTGATYVMMPSTIVKTFGIQYSGVIFGALTYMELIASSVPMILYEYLSDKLSIYIVILIILGILVILLALLYETENLKLKKLNSNTKPKF